MQHTQNAICPWAVRYNSVAVFLFFALALNIHRGHSHGVVLMLLAAFWMLWRAPRHMQQVLQREHYALMLLFVLTAALGFVDALQRGSWAAAEKPFRYVICILLLPWLALYPPRLGWLWWGVAVGGVGVGLSTLYYSYMGPELGIERAARYLNAIQLGGGAMLLAVLCACKLVIDIRQRVWRDNWLLTVLLGLGSLGGAVAAVLTQSRGSWLALVLYLAFCMVWQRRWLWQNRWPALMLAAVLSLTLWGALTTHGVVTQRVAEVAMEASAFAAQADDTTSIGARLSMWQFAWHEGWRYPLLGPGRVQMMLDKQAWVQAGHASVAIVDFGHLHNELLDAFATRGLLGVVALLALYGVPLAIFWRADVRQHPDLQAVRSAGIALVLLYMGFGLTQVFFAHNSGLMLYVPPICIFASLLLARQQPASPAPASQRLD